MQKRQWCSLLYLPSLAVLSGILLALALPPRSAEALGWIAFLPLLFGIRLMPRPLVMTGCGMLLSLATVAILVDGRLSLSAFGNLLGAFGCLALAFAFTACIAAVGWKRISWGLWPVLVGAAGVTAELLSIYTFPLNVAITQHSNPAALFLASLTGVWGISFFIWFVPASIVALMSGGKKALVPAAVSLVAVILSFTWPDAVPDMRHTANVAAVQARNCPDADMATRKLSDKVQLVVWPEHLAYTKNRIAYRCAESTRKYIVASFAEPVGRKKLYNAAFVISPEGEKVGVCRKTHLFGREIYTYSRGAGLCITDCGGTRAGVAICFEAMFTDVVRRLARGGAEIVLIPNSDPEMPGMLMNHLHFGIIPFRAAENGVPIVWAESQGLSSVIDGSGAVLKSAGAGMCAVESSVGLRERTTLYTRIGDSFAYACAGIVVALLFAAVLSRKSPNNTGTTAV